jgi:hypothetical protein
MALQRLDLHGDRRGCEVQNLGGTCEAQVFGDLGENPELAEGGALD